MEETMQRWAQKIISTLEASIVQSDQRTNEIIAKLHDIRSAYHRSPVGNQPYHPAPSTSPKLAFQPSNPVVRALQPPHPAPISPPTPPPIAAPPLVATPLPGATPLPVISPPPIATPPPMAYPPPIATPPPATPSPIAPPPPLMTYLMLAPAAPVDPSATADPLIGKSPAADPQLSPPDLLSASRQIRRSSSSLPPSDYSTIRSASPLVAAIQLTSTASDPPDPKVAAADPPQPTATRPSPCRLAVRERLTPHSPSLPLQPISPTPPLPLLPAPLSDPLRTIFLASRSSRLHDRSAGYRPTGDLLHRSNLEPPRTPFPATDPPRLLLRHFHCRLQPPRMPALSTDLPLLLLRRFDRHLYRLRTSPRRQNCRRHHPICRPCPRHHHSTRSSSSLLPQTAAGPPAAPAFFLVSSAAEPRRAAPPLSCVPATLATCSRRRPKLGAQAWFVGNCEGLRGITSRINLVSSSLPPPLSLLRSPPPLSLLRSPTFATAPSVKLLDPDPSFPFCNSTESSFSNPRRIDGDIS